MLSSSLSTFLATALVASSALVSASPALNSRQSGSGASKYQSPSANWSLQGCAQDGYPNYRVLEGAGYFSSNSLTIDSCLSYCDSQGAHLAGLENGNQCFCGPHLLNGGTIRPSGANLNSANNDGCSTDATGAKGRQNGGGPNHVLVFASNKRPEPTNANINGATYLGCYKDNESNRLLPTWANGNDQSNSIAKCAKECKNIDQNFDLFGVEYRQECHCAKSSQVKLSNSLKGDGCLQSCTGDNSQLCGGGGYLSVYKYTSAAPAGASSSKASTTAASTTAASTTAASSSKASSSTATPASSSTAGSPSSTAATSKATATSSDHA